MDPVLKRRLLVAIIIIALIVIFVPIPFGHLDKQATQKPLSHIPAQPDLSQVTQPIKPSQLTFQQTHRINAGFKPISRAISKPIPASKPVLVKRPAKKKVKVAKKTRTSKLRTDDKAKRKEKLKIAVKATKPSMVWKKAVKVEHKSKLKIKPAVRAKKKTANFPASPVVAEVGGAMVTQSDLSGMQPKFNIRQNDLSSNNAANVSQAKALKAHIEAAKKMDQAWVAQLGSFQDSSVTEQVVNKLRKNGYSAFSYQAKVRAKIYYRVYVGPFLHLDQANKVLKAVKKKFRISGYVHKFDATNLD